VQIILDLAVSQSAADQFLISEIVFGQEDDGGSSIDLRD